VAAASGAAEMIELFIMFKNFVVTYPMTENAMIASSYLAAWVTRYPHATIEEAKIRRPIADEFGNAIPRLVTEYRVRINENVPDDLRA
jgi:hypothetical protein